MKARERQRQRREERDMVSRTGRTSSSRQAAPEGSFKLPEIQIKGGRLWLLIPLGIVVIASVILALRLLTPSEEVIPPNAIWLNAAWAYQEHGTEELINLASQLRTNRIGEIFLYVSSLKGDGTWSGALENRNRFDEVEPRLEALITNLRAVYPNLRIYAWVEVNASTPSYRLDDLQIQNTITNFTGRMVNVLEFDGVLLDVKPIFEENEDYIQILRNVRREITTDKQLLVAVPPDLTPSGTSLSLPSVIAPSTEWSSEYKQRVALLANQIIITAYNSYQSNPVNYIEWVAYQVDSYIAALSELADTSTTIMLSLPNYANNPPAHDTDIESLAGALDGVTVALSDLEEGQELFFGGVAIYSDHLPSDAEWAVFLDKWGR
jgi:hypothetical protein